MTQKAGSSADGNWSLQDCLPQSRAALYQLTVAQTLRQVSKVQHGLLVFVLGWILHFPSQGSKVFYQSKSPLNASLQAAKKPVAQVRMKNSKLSLFLQTQNLI